MISAYWKTALATLLLILAGFLWWHFLELRDVPVKRPNPARQENPWLAAKLLAEQQGIKVTLPAALDLALGQTRGTLYLPHTGDQLDEPKAKSLWRWVAEGNTLILQPRHSRRELYPFSEQSGMCDYRPLPGPTDKAADEPADEPADEAADESDQPAKLDPISSKFGVSLWAVFQSLPKGAPSRGANDKIICHSQLMRPGQAYPFAIDTRHNVLQARPDAAQPLYSDRDGVALRVYREGKGHVVLLADSYFDNRQLREYDHAALWLALLQLPGAKPELAILRSLDAIPWYQKLWQTVPLLLLGLVPLLLLWFGNGLMRFGALLPAPEAERRALLEHIDASSRWLWHTPGGGQLLLDAMRRQTSASLMRRAPAIARLPAAELVEVLLQATGLARERLDAAFNAPAAHVPQPFIAQIQTLQQVRNHYER